MRWDAPFVIVLVAAGFDAAAGAACGILLGATGCCPEVDMIVTAAATFVASFSRSVAATEKKQS